jgi:hypothetical protein
MAYSYLHSFQKHIRVQLTCGINESQFALIFYEFKWLDEITKLSIINSDS